MHPTADYRPAAPVLVVGTTPDYVVRLHNRYPGRVVFLLRKCFKNHPALVSLDPSALYFSAFEDYRETLAITKEVLFSRGLAISGIACFDCDALMTAAKLAADLGKKFPAPEAISLIRNKFLSKEVWRRRNVSTPPGIYSDRLEDTLDFFRLHKSDVVLKPVSGSGSELVFYCESEAQVKEAVHLLTTELPKRATNPLFNAPADTPSVEMDIPFRPGWIAECFVPGPEFSCDFILNSDQIHLIRATGKIKAPDQTFGTVLAYLFPARFPDGFSTKKLNDLLKQAAIALGFDWGYFMADFIIRDNEPVLIELTPRPGGDSIPDLFEMGTKTDLLGIYLDFVSGGALPEHPQEIPPCSFASVNLFAPREGAIQHLDISQIANRKEVAGVILKKGVGDRLALPPADYDNRLLGYCLIADSDNIDLINLYHQLHNDLKISVI